MNRQKLLGRLASVGCGIALAVAVVVAAGCRSHHVEITVENRTGTAIELLEVDYPSASFGADSIAAGAVFHYRIQLQGSGPLKVQYTVGGKAQQVTGPQVFEGQQGSLRIVLEPNGKSEMLPQLTPKAK
jgi:hypothetical protein